MLIQPCDATTGTDEWRTWLADSDRFALLAVNHAQLADLQREGRHAKMSWNDDHKPPAHRERVAVNLERRAHGSGAGAPAQQPRRLAALGDWRQRRSRA